MVNTADLAHGAFKRVANCGHGHNRQSKICKIFARIAAGCRHTAIEAF